MSTGLLDRRWYAASERHHEMESTQHVFARFRFGWYDRDRLFDTERGADGWTSESGQAVYGLCAHGLLARHERGKTST